MDARGGLVLVDPEVDGVLALGARVREKWEPLFERDAEDFDVDNEGVTLSHHPDIVCKDHARDEVDKVVAPQSNHK